MAVWEVTGIDSNGAGLTYAIRLEKEPEFRFRVTTDTQMGTIFFNFPFMGITQRSITRKIFKKSERGKRVEIKKSKSLEGNFDEELSALKELVGRYRVPFFI